MTDKPEVMNGESLDIAAQRRAELKQLFPGVFTETKDANGKIVSSIDFERLKAELGTFSDLYEGRRERYGMDWPGKRDCMKIIQEPSRATLKPCPEDSIDWDTTQNIFIEGENLEVLKLLQKSYYGKIKMIYIDPPYNTGGEFIYPDNYQESLETYLSYTGMIDDEGRRFSTNTLNEGRYHSKWLNMMYPRLFLSRNLLSQDGVIFISIDDNEQVNLRKICDEIFGEENFVAQFIWEKRITRENRKAVSTRHDYILCYVKSWIDAPEAIGLLPMDEAAIDRYKNPDNDPRGVWTSVPAIAQGGHATKSQFYTLTTPSGRKVNPPSGSCWRYTESKMQEAIADNKIWFGADGNGVPRIKKFLTEGRQGLTPETMWWSKDVGNNDSAKRDLVNLFDGKSVFDTPKPVGLMDRMLDIVGAEQGIVLDFFAGSAPLAASVLRRQANDKNLKLNFIAVQLPEPIDENSEAYSFGMRSISSITINRIKKEIEKIGINKKNGCDLGVKVFKLSSSAFKMWNSKSINNVNDVQSSLDFMSSNINEESSSEEILYEIMLKAGFSITEQVSKIKLADKTVYSIGHGALILCLEGNITSDLIDKVIELQPMQFICLDKGFSGNDQLKANTSHAFKARSINSDSEMVFKVI